MIDRRFIETKLSYIRGYYQDLEGVLGYSDQEIKGDVLKLRALERVIQLIVDEIIDINNHFIRYAQLRVPEDFQSAFYSLLKTRFCLRDLREGWLLWLDSGIAWSTDTRK
ncbi:MAG: DUF86 domain-containing protein [Thermodesulfobacteriota bacterium]|nr:DUF86 domain-containing protein [Thermodesulfobacteriota bacterium]